MDIAAKALELFAPYVKRGKRTSWMTSYFVPRKGPYTNLAKTVSLSLLYRQKLIMPKVKRSRKPPPDGWELIEPTLDELDQKMREGKSEIDVHHDAASQH